MNISILDLVLLFTTVIFALIATYLIIAGMMNRKTIMNALENSQSTLKVQLSDNETSLKKTLRPLFNDDVEKKTAELLSIERDTYKNLIRLYVDYHPAAIEMTPTLINQIISAYIQCIEHIVEHIESSKTTNESKTHTKKSTDSAKDLPEDAHYESQIKQLHAEKQDLTNKYKDASRLLHNICHHYKDQLQLTVDDSLEQMNLKQIAQLFKIEFSPTDSTTKPN